MKNGSYDPEKQVRPEGAKAKAKAVQADISTRQKSSIRLRQMMQIAILSAIAAVLMYFEFPLPFLAPGFYKLDLSEVPVLIGAFAMGPIAGAVIEALKIVLHVLLKGTSTAFVGDFANFVVGCALVMPASIVYRLHKSRKTALVGLILGTISMAVIGVLMNAYVLLPAYAKAFGMDVSVFIEMGAAIHSSVHDILTFCILLVAPFNLVKGLLLSVITMLLYKRISVLLKSSWR